MDFIKKYSELSVQEQASCARFPLKANGVRYASQQEFLASDNFMNRPIVSSRKRLSKDPNVKMFKELFMPIPEDGIVIDAKDEIVYVVRKRKDTMEVLLTQSGSYIFETVTFVRKDDYWRVLELKEESNDY